MGACLGEVSLQPVSRVGHDTVAPQILGQVHRVVGTGDQVTGGVALPKLGHAEARGDMPGVPRKPQLLDGHAEALGAPEGVLGI